VRSINFDDQRYIHEDGVTSYDMDETPPCLMIEFVCLHFF